MLKVTIKTNGPAAHQAGSKLLAKTAKGYVAAGPKVGVGLAHGVQRHVEHGVGRHALQAKLTGPVAQALPAQAKASALKAVGGAAKVGTVWTGSGPSLGFGVGLGAVGPLLLLTALGLVASGIYIYIRNRSVHPPGGGGDDAQPD